METVWTEKLTMKIGTPMISSFLYVKPFTKFKSMINSWCFRA